MLWIVNKGNENIMVNIIMHLYRAMIWSHLKYYVMLYWRAGESAEKIIEMIKGLEHHPYKKG